MLRSDARDTRFTGGKLFIGEVGDPVDEPDFRTIFAYSLLHNIHADALYPAMLVTTTDEDRARDHYRSYLVDNTQVWT